jgi:hypothetical protein
MATFDISRPHVISLNKREKNLFSVLKSTKI